MYIRSRVLLLALAFAAAAWTPTFGQSTRTARGVVYHDKNGNGIRDAGEPGIAHVRVSNQRMVVATNARGEYELPVDDDTILFVIKPRNWQPLRDENGVTRCYYIHKPNGSPKLHFSGVPPTGPLPSSVDFPLRPAREPDRFRVIMFGDTQPRDQREIDYIAHDVIEGLLGTPAAFGVTLGDVTYNDLALFPVLKRTIGTLGIPWYYVMGNHDTNQDAPSDELSDETFEREFGPPYYSFDYGPVHFIVLDDIQWRPRTENASAGYTAGIGPKQLEFLRNDLSFVPRNQLVVLMMHIPLEAVAERQQIFRLLETRPNTFSLSAHTHTQEHRFLGKDAGWQGSAPHHHLIHGTVCGSWWSGAPDELGIPHATMSDGVPNGYSLITFSGTRYSIEYRAARRPADYQMNIYAPEEVAVAELPRTQVVVNIFAGSLRSVVEMRVDNRNEWQVMTQAPAQDPAYAAMKELEKGPKPPPGRTLPGISRPSHMWSAPLPADLAPGVHVITVRTRDMFGQVYEGRRIFRVL